MKIWKVTTVNGNPATLQNALNQLEAEGSVVFSVDTTIVPATRQANPDAPLEHFTVPVWWVISYKEQSLVTL